MAKDVEVKQLADNEAKLSDGRVVTVRELVGSDEMIVAAQLGKVFTPDGGGAVVFQSCLIARSVESINGQPVTPMRSYSEYRDFLAMFKSKDYSKIKKLYDKVNGDDAEGND